MGNKFSEYLKTIDNVIKNGTYKDTWQSLSDYKVPVWYKNAKFGIFIHWGVYSVPAFGNEWYPRNMYIKGTKEFEHHVNTYGNQKDFSYADFIPMFKGEHFNAREWIDIIKSSGAKYVMPVAEHHDGFQMYDSELSAWNAAKMGPKRDVLGELKAASEEEDLVFCASSHRAENYWFFAGSRNFDSGIQNIVCQEPYGYANKDFSKDEHNITHNIYSTPASKEHLENWLTRTCEIVDKYHPKIMYFDWWIQNMSFKSYLKKFAAYYYNRALEWGEEVAINYKYDAFAYSTAIFDIERGQLGTIRARLWQTDTSIGINSWGYTESNEFKSPVDIICNLIDIVSKNGCLLLNIGPKPDGTITEEEKNVLSSIGIWMKTNGESIYNTIAWNTFGEGSTEVPEGAFTDVDRVAFTNKDIRFTYKAPYLYANVLSWPQNNKVIIKSLKKQSKNFLGPIEFVEIIGYDTKPKFYQDDEGLVIETNTSIHTLYPVCLKITLN